VATQPPEELRPPPQVAAGQPSPSAAEGRPRWQKLGCIGCLSIGGLLSCCLVATLIFGPGIWQRLGLLRSRAEELYSGAPDPFATRVILQILEDARIAGASAVVIPIRGSDGQIAIISLDPNEGFDGTGTAAGNEALFMNVIQRMREDNRMQELGLERVAVDYRDESGQSLVTITASETAMEALAQGEITQEQFLKDVDIGVAGLGLREALALMQEGS
jgi:hypothetical protein